MKKKNVDLKKLNFYKTAIVSLTRRNANDIMGGGSALSLCDPCDNTTVQSKLASCDDFCPSKDCVTQTCFKDCK